MQKDTQRKFKENSDRYNESGLFPSRVFARLKQETQKNGGCTVYFPDENMTQDAGFIVGYGEHGFTLTPKQFYSEHTIETTFADFLAEWHLDGRYHGFGSWYDHEKDLICIDPITVCIGIKTALKLAEIRGEHCIYDAQNKMVINTC